MLVNELIAPFYLFLDLYSIGSYQSNRLLQMTLTFRLCPVIANNGQLANEVKKVALEWHAWANSSLFMLTWEYKSWSGNKNVGNTVSRFCYMSFFFSFFFLPISDTRWFDSIRDMCLNVGRTWKQQIRIHRSMVFNIWFWFSSFQHYEDGKFQDSIVSFRSLFLCIR